jgi:membrane-associated protein
LALSHSLIDMLRNPGELIAWGGYPALALIVFLETGAMVFFLPGDSLLVMAGFYAAKGDLNLIWLNLLLCPLAVLGDACSYTIGRRMGPQLFNRPGARLLKPQHLAAAQAFYDRHGGRAIILARFVPVVRTFVPIVAGVAGMQYRRFFTYNAVGGIGWVASMTCLGFTLARVWPGAVDHAERVVLAVVAVSLLPGLIEFARAHYAGPKAPPRTPDAE